MKPATELPWKAGVNYPSRINGGGNMVASTAENGLDEQFPDRIQKENAAYIAHCANAYPQLVAALRGMLEVFGQRLADNPFEKGFIYMTPSLIINGISHS